MGAAGNDIDPSLQSRFEGVWSIMWAGVGPSSPHEAEVQGYILFFSKTSLVVIMLRKDLGSWC